MPPDLVINLRPLVGVVVPGFQHGHQHLATAGLPKTFVVADDLEDVLRPRIGPMGAIHPIDGPPNALPLAAPRQLLVRRIDLPDWMAELGPDVGEAHLAFERLP